MRSDEHAAVQALVDAVTAAGVAVGMEANVRAWLDVRAARDRVSALLAVPVDEVARRVHGAEPPTYFLEVKGDPLPPDDPAVASWDYDPESWECPGCGYESEDCGEALGMLRWSVGEGKRRRIVRQEHVYTVVREVGSDFPANWT